MQFEFSTAGKIIFGRGKFIEIGEIVDAAGQKILLISGQTGRWVKELTKQLETGGAQVSNFSVSGEPKVKDVRTGVKMARKEQIDLVIAIGGGSVIDAGKAIACLAKNEGEIEDYLEVIGRGKQISRSGLKMIAIPTTGGTGGEATRNSVLGVPEEKVKVSLRSDYLLPSMAIIDPELSMSVPAEITAYTGMDALTQLIEPYVSNRTNPLTDALCVHGMELAADALLRAYDNGEDIEAREKMCLASLLGGMALANAKLGAIHGFAGVIGGMYAAPHGAICSRLAAPVIEINLKALQERNGDPRIIKRYEKIASILTGNAKSSTGDLVNFVKHLNQQLQIPPLSNYGVSKEDFAEIIVKAARSSSMKGNPIILDPDELWSILEMAV